LLFTTKEMDPKTLQRCETVLKNKPKKSHSHKNLQNINILPQVSEPSFEPGEIFWENLEITRNARRLRTTFVWLCLLVMLGGSL